MALDFATEKGIHNLPSTHVQRFRPPSESVAVLYIAALDPQRLVVEALGRATDRYFQETFWEGGSVGEAQREHQGDRLEDRGECRQTDGIYRRYRLNTGTTTCASSVDVRVSVGMVAGGFA